MKRSATAPALPAKIARSDTSVARPSLFCHQSYSTSPPRAPHYYLRPQIGPALISGDFRRRMQLVGESLARAEVKTFFLLHGSFAAIDSLTILSALGRRCRQARHLIRRLTSQLVDPDVRDAGNYTPAFAEALETGLGPAAAQIAVRVLSWSSENHHLGRADAAVRLIDELAALELAAGERVVLWGHGHAGNVFALMSQLLSSQPAAIERFFQAASVFYRWPLMPLIDVPVWRRVRQMLLDDRQRMANRPCDWVTFGTPLRYGWKLRPCDKLLHFIHHRPDAARPAHLASFPVHTDEVLHGTKGDFLQQVAIAGTDTPPPPLIWRSWLANRRLGKLLENDHAVQELANLLEAGARVPDCGTTLLVDYGANQGSPAEHLAGHAVYTRPEWLLFHAERMVQHLYGGTGTRVKAA